MKLSGVKTLNLRAPEKDDAELGLVPYDNTKLVAYNTCPTWGVLRYHQHKVMPNSGRAMALEAGTAMHEVFSYVRLITLQQQVKDDMTAEDADTLIHHHGVRLFGEQRWQQINESQKSEGMIDAVKIGAITVLETSGFYDDDRDRYRTLTNLEEAALAYIDRWNWKHTVWMRDSTDPRSDVGIEIPFDLVMEATMEGGVRVPLFRFTGKLDGLRWHNNRLTVEDNKTTSRINDTWELAYETSHQITGYMAAASVFVDTLVDRGEVLGLQIPQPRSSGTGYARVPLSRDVHQFVAWSRWALHTVSGYQVYGSRPMEAPQYTHSCMRYFRPCSFIPFCVADPEEQERIIDEMDTQEWSPLHTVGDTDG